MKKQSAILALAMSLCWYNVQAQCTTTIQTDTLICAGSQATLVADVSGPDNVLAASNTAGNNHRGNMFDIVATNAVKILSFDVSPMSSTTIEIYYKTGTWNGFANTPSAWTFVGSAPVTYTGSFIPVAVPVNVVIPAGQTYAFYVTSSNQAVSLNYTDGTSVGNVYSSDANISFLEGGGMEYPFTQGTGSVFQPRVWNGNIHYALADLPTTYLWNTSETNDSIQATLSNDTQFTVETTIAGCPTMHDTVTIHTSIPLVNAGADQVICAGDSVTLTASGNADSYTWDNGVTDGLQFAPAATATYTLVGLDTLGCADTAQVTVSVNTLPAVYAGTDLAICIGDSVTLTGQGADQYQWDNGVVDGVPFAPMDTMDYIVQGTDLNGCSNNDTLTVIVHTLPAVSAGDDVDACAGQDITFSGAGAITYAWNNGVVNGQPFTPSGSGDFIVIGTDFYGCSGMDTVSVTVHTVDASLTVSGATLQASTTPGLSYSWFDCTTQQNIAGETASSFTPANTGSYGVLVSDQYGCMDTSACEVIDFTGLSEETLTYFRVYPNPSTGLITVESSASEIESVEIYDIIGNLVFVRETKAFGVSIDLSAFQGSQFIAKISGKDGYQLVKILKQ